MKVWNKRDPKTPKDAIYVGRPTKYGNKYSHRSSNVPGTIIVATREEAIKRFEEDLMQNPALIRDAKRELRGKDLVCWCSPAACHAEILMKIANS